LAVAIPVLLYGLSVSEIHPIAKGALSEGHSLFYAALIWCVKGPIPEGHDVFLSAPAFAGWVGLLVTMMNLVPSGQLDGGHVAYALMGPKQDLISRYVRRSLLAAGFVIGAGKATHAWLQGATDDAVQTAMLGGINWILWGLILTGMARFTGELHPPTEPGALSPRRKWIACVTLAWFVLLFMPTWLSET
jgi:membrane-associated protease RseP (regulator of RpoE activity)